MLFQLGLASCDGLRATCTATPPFVSKAASEESKLIFTEEKLSLDFPAPLMFMSSLYILNYVPQTAVGSGTER